MAIKPTPLNVVSKGVGASKKKKSTTTESTHCVQLSPPKALDPPVNVIDNSLNEPSDSEDIFRRKKLNLNPTH